MANKRISQLTNTITAFRTGDYIAVDGPSGTAKMGKDDLLKETAENAIIKSVSAKFDPSKPNGTDGYAYHKDDLVEYNGVLYRFAVDKSSGPWDSNVVEMVLIDNLIEASKKMILEQNPEYVYVLVDTELKVLFGIKENGDVEWGAGVPAPIREEIEKLVPKEYEKSLIDSFVADNLKGIENPQFYKVLVDSEDKIIFGLTNDFKFNFQTPVKFSSIEWSPDNISELAVALKENGFQGGSGDWSDSPSLEIKKPELAIVNISGPASMPTTKSQDLNAVLEFWDKDGNYFKKNIKKLNAQGNSSLIFTKKNFSFDFSDFVLKFGDWVPQDSFHLKAYYTDFFKGCSVICYKIADIIQKSRGVFKDRPWKEGLIDFSEISSDTYKDPSKVGSFASKEYNDIDLQIDNGARCMPDAFPCALFHNGAFYGIYSFSLKKNRDNYHMKKNKALQIHLDGDISPDTLWGGAIDWTMFEVRNPKISVDKDGNPYDGDHPTEIPDSSTKTAIINLSTRMSEIASAATDDEKKALFETYFDVDNLIDYELTQLVCYDRDSIVKNVQWITYDGVKWYACNYDKDLSFGNYVSGQFTYPCPNGGAWISVNGTPFEILVTLYSDEIKQRWDYLTTNKIISAELVKGLFSEWVASIGADNFKKEYERWPESPCCRSRGLNSNWEIANVYLYYNPQSYNSAKTYGSGEYVKESSSVYKSLAASNVGHTPSTSPTWWENVDYDPTRTYQVGETCWFGYEFKIMFTCLTSCTGETPLTVSYTNYPKDLGYYDSFWRLCDFIDKRFSVLESWFENL